MLGPKNLLFQTINLSSVWEINWPMGWKNLSDYKFASLITKHNVQKNRSLTQIFTAALQKVKSNPIKGKTLRKS